MKKSLKVIFWVLTLCLMLVPMMAFAQENYEDISGNYFTYDNSASGKDITLDLYGAGQNVTVNGSKMGASALLAGQNVKIENSVVGGSVRAAGFDVNVSNCEIACNATLAGYSVHFVGDASAKAVFTAAENVEFSGSCNTLYACANKVVISGTINGDADIFADSVTITEGAVINGTLNVSAASEPAIASGAVVNGINYKETIDKDAVVAAGKTVGIVARLTGLITLIPARIILALVFFLIIRKQIAQAADMVTKRPVAMPISGLVTFIAVPAAAIMLFITIIGALTGGFLLALYAFALIFSTTFAGCVGGKLLFPKMNMIVSSIIGVAIVTVAGLIPILGTIVTIVCMVYTLGFFIQKIYLGFPKKNHDNEAQSSSDNTSLPQNSDQN